MIPVRDRADVVGRAVAGVLAQTFADLELVVVDDGSTDDTVAAARAVADQRVRIVRQDAAGTTQACRAGLASARGRWATVIDADTEVGAAWLARFGLLVDRSGAAFVSCGGEQRHPDGSLTEILPRDTGTDGSPAVCLRPGAFATERTRLLDAVDGVGPRDASPRDIAGVALHHVLEEGLDVVHTPERLVAWSDRPAAPTPQGDELRLQWAFQALEAMARTPIPDGELLARYATIGGVAAARLRRGTDARLLFRIACQARPEVRKHWARLAVCHVPALSARIWDPTEPADGPDAGAVPMDPGTTLTPAG